LQKRTLLLAAGLTVVLAAASVVAVLALRGRRDGPAAAPTTSTSSPATTAGVTTTSAGTTTTLAPSTTLEPRTITLDLPGEDGLPAAARAFYAWLGDPSGAAPPAMDPSLEEYAAGAAAPGDLTLVGESATAELADGTLVGVVAAGEDVLLGVDEGAGWRLVGARLESLGLGARYGEPVRLVMVIGTDARPGQNEPYYRADSLHLLASNIARRAGAIVGFPRDTWVPAPYGNDKLTHVNALADTAALVAVVRDLTGLPVEGYLITGFRSFRRMVDAFGGVTVDVPFAMNDPKSSAFLQAGRQLLMGQDALAFSRNRRISGSDFTRSFHQGLVIAAGLAGVQERGILALPDLLALLSRYTWTDLAPGDLLTLAAGAYEIDPAAVTNLVLPGTVGTVGAASVVFLDDAAQDIYADLADGVLTPEP
jgi:LCP family protein required for cell wall assembly